MILYAVKTKDGYLRDKRDAGIFVTKLASASVFPEKDGAAKLKKQFGEGQIAELTLTERLLLPSEE
ncbi:MAG TPA: hypothetical protein PKD52_02405 [Clostridiales bacterium]|nr:hypothetical protein [Clostridiales bacterium]